MVAMAKNNDAQIEALFNVHAHIGHRKNRVHPRARQFMYKFEDGVSIIDLTKTAEQVNRATDFLNKLGSSGKNVLVVATKKIVNSFTAELCTKENIPYITAKWLPGLLTNFETIMKNVSNLRQLQEDKKNNVWDKFVKHERIQLEKKMNRLRKWYNGILSLDKFPDALLIIDSKREHNALTEAQQFKIPVVSIVDTNSDPFKVPYPIVANDDSADSVEYILNELISAYTNGRQTQKKVA